MSLFHCHTPTWEQRWSPSPSGLFHSNTPSLPAAPPTPTAQSLPWAWWWRLLTRHHVSLIVKLLQWFHRSHHWSPIRTRSFSETVRVYMRSLIWFIHPGSHYQHTSKGATDTTGNETSSKNRYRHVNLIIPGDTSSTFEILILSDSRGDHLDDAVRRWESEGCVGCYT